MHIPIQANIYCVSCKKCGAKPVVDQQPGGKFRIVCPNNIDHYKIKSDYIDVEEWNSANEMPAGFRKVG
jgi:hypothetical protein